MKDRKEVSHNSRVYELLLPLAQFKNHGAGAKPFKWTDVENFKNLEKIVDTVSQWKESHVFDAVGHLKRLRSGVRLKPTSGKEKASAVRRIRTVLKSLFNLLQVADPKYFPEINFSRLNIELHRLRDYLIETSDRIPEFAKLDFNSAETATIYRDATLQLFGLRDSKRGNKTLIERDNHVLALVEITVEAEGCTPYAAFPIVAVLIENTGVKNLSISSIKRIYTVLSRTKPSHPVKKSQGMKKNRK